MRPITRGDVPTGSPGTPKTYAAYGDARPDLVERIGEYCSYCERNILQGTGLAVEHIYAKKYFPARELDWENFLLSCTNCNSVKKDGDANFNHAYFLWPHLDNTARVFRYLAGGLVTPDPALSVGPRTLAADTLRLTGLDRYPGAAVEPAAQDFRWQHRREAWDIAQRALARLTVTDCVPMREQIVDTAIQTGFWSVWMSVFARDSDMRTRLVNAFRGTAIDCFNADAQPIRRDGGLI